MITLFGPGVVQGLRTDVSGASPCNFGKIKSCTFDKSFTVKALTGQSQAPIAFGRGALKFTGKLKMAAWSPLAANNFFWGVTAGTGGTLEQFLEAGTIPGSTSYTVTVANAATWVATQEVLYATTGEPFKIVASGSEAAGACSVAAGVYTFAAADANKAVLISYTYTVTTGFSSSITGQLQGFTPTFSLVFYQFDTATRRPLTLTLPYCTAEKLADDFKEDDFDNPELDILIGQNAAGQIATWSYPELS